MTASRVLTRAVAPRTTDQLASGPRDDSALARTADVSRPSRPSMSNPAIPHMRVVLNEVREHSAAWTHRSRLGPGGTRANAVHDGLRAPPDVRSPLVQFCQRPPSRNGGES